MFSKETGKIPVVTGHFSSLRKKFRKVTGLLANGTGPISKVPGHFLKLPVPIGEVSGPIGKPHGHFRRLPFSAARVRAHSRRCPCPHERSALEILRPRRGGARSPAITSLPAEKFPE